MAFNRGITLNAVSVENNNDERLMHTGVIFSLIDIYSIDGTARLSNLLITSYYRVAG